MKHNRNTVSGYEQMVVERIKAGWSATLLSIMYNQLDPKDGPIQEQMRWAVERVYAKLLARTIRVTNGSRNWRYQVWIVCPDFPVPKNDKDHLRDIIVNGGRHLHALALTLGNGRLRMPLAEYVDVNQRIFTGWDKPIWRIDAKTIDHDAGYTLRYVLKQLERGRLAGDDVHILPKSESEMH